MIRAILILATLVFSQNARTPTLADFFHHKQSGNPFELWTYHFAFDNGTQAWLTYSLVDLPAIGEKVAAELAFYQFKGKNKSVGKQFDRKEWKEDANKATLSVRKSYAMEGLPGPGHRVRFSTSKNEDYSLDLTFSHAVHGLAADAQKMEGTLVNTVVHIPRGNVQGVITIGKDTLNVKGTGTLVHTWHAKPATDFAKRSIAFFTSDGTILAGRLLQAKSSSQMGGYLVKLEQGSPKLLVPQTMDIKGNQATIRWANSQTAPLVLDFSKPYQKYSTLSTVDSWIERQAAKVAMGGERILYRGTTKNDLGTLQWVATGFED